MTDVNIEPIEPNDEDLAKNQVRFDVTITNRHPRDTLAAIVRTDPCAFRGHRPARRVDGGIECYDCGARFV